MTAEVRETNHRLAGFSPKPFYKSVQIGEIRGRKELETLFQIAKFMTVGVLNTGIDAATYFILTRWLGFGTLPVLAKGIAYIVGMVNSFFWNRTWTFGDKGDIWRAAGLFTLTHIFALAINAGTMALALEWLGLPEIIALGAATGRRLSGILCSISWLFSSRGRLVLECFSRRPRRRFST